MESQIKKIHKQLVSKDVTCTDLVKSRLDLLKENKYNSVNSLLDYMALELASKVDFKIANGDKIELLEGIPFGIKDVYMVQGTTTTASSKMLRNYKSPYTATAIQKLLDAGAIPLVKENCDSFGHGSSSENTVFGAVKNSIDSELVAGGSSGGSAVNVAKDYTVFSIGGDTGGSIRQPAGYNKIYGLKPTYGCISRYGLLSYASSTDCVGPLAKSIEDIRILLNVMSGKDPKDQTTIDSQGIEEEEILKDSKSLKVGYFKNLIEGDSVDISIKSDFLKTIDNIEAKGMKVKELDSFERNILVSVYYILAMGETASNLSRLDGTNYGNRIEKGSLKETYSVTRSKSFSEESKRRIVGGNQVLSQGFSDEIYLKGLALRDQISKSFDKYFEDIDIILSPVTPNTPPVIGDSLKSPLEMYFSDMYTVGFSLGQLPTLTVPHRISTGLQITAAKNEEKTILRFANFLKEIP